MSEKLVITVYGYDGLNGPGLTPGPRMYKVEIPAHQLDMTTIHHIDIDFDSGEDRLLHLGHVDCAPRLPGEENRRD